MSETIGETLRGVASVVKDTDDGITCGLAGWCLKAAAYIDVLEVERDHWKHRAEVAEQSDREHGNQLMQQIAEVDRLRDLLAAVRGGEPVAWMRIIRGSSGPDMPDEYEEVVTSVKPRDESEWTALYTAPPIAAQPPAQYSDIISDGGFDPRNKFDAAPALTNEVAHMIAKRCYESYRSSNPMSLQEACLLAVRETERAIRGGAK